MQVWVNYVDSDQTPKNATSDQFQDYVPIIQ